MILRRLTEHVKAQNWFAVAIDFVIVVMGVFIGIQVANWNGAQADKRLGRAYAERLSASLAADLQSRKGLAAYYAAVLDSVERTNALLAEPASDPKALVVNAYRASEVNFTPQSRAAWDEIVSSGDTGLLPRAAIDSGIADYFAGDTARLTYDVAIASAYRRRVRTIIPLDLQKALRAGCSDIRDEDQVITGFMPHCVLDVPAETIAATAASLRADPAVAAELRYQYSDVFSAHANISGDVVILERALKALRGADGPGAP